MEYTGWRFEGNRCWAYNFIAAVAKGEKIPQTLVQDWFATQITRQDGITVIFQVVKDLKLDRLAAIKLYRAFTLEGLAEAKQAVERACFPFYKFVDAAFCHRFWAMEPSAALAYIDASSADRFRRVGENQYKLVDSSSFAIYIIPDRMMKLV